MEAQTEPFEIVVNGDRRLVDPGVTVAGIVELLGLPADRVAVELDRRIVRRPDWEGTRLASGSQLEIVHFVGGG